jgi:hypothetical protein
MSRKLIGPEYRRDAGRRHRGTQYLPFADAKALAVYDTFERGAYQLLNAM